MPETRIAERPPRAHSVHIEERRLISMTGVIDVDSFCEKQVQLLTEAGILHIEGEELRVTKLDLDGGVVMLEGVFYAMEYEDNEPKASKWGKLFR